MAHVAPLELDAIRDPELRLLVERARGCGVPDERFIGVAARAPGYAVPLLKALLLSHLEGHVDHRLKEIIRIRLARAAGDPYFAALRSAQAMRAGLTEELIEAGCGRYETDPRFSEAEKAALRYAEWMYVAPQSVDAEFYAELKRHYSEAQIMELGAFIAFHRGMQAFMRTLGV